jgi:hypothetical protein
MPRHHFVISARGNPLWVGVFLLAAIGCSDERSSPGPTVARPLPADEGRGQGGPLDLSYVCGNRFLVYSTYNVPISVTYRVGESGEEGTVEVPAAPSIDPASTEELFETRSKGTVQIFLNGKPIVARANGGAVCTPSAGGAAAMAGGQAMASSWVGPFDMPIVAVHMMLLPNGRVLSIGRTGTPQVWNPACGTGLECFTATPSPPAWLFCAGHALLSDGRVLVAGGHIKDRFGLPNITLFTGSGTSGTWASSMKMARGRWYPTATTMANGEVVITAGTDENAADVLIPEVWQNGTVRQLTTASKELQWYPRAFLAPNGLLYVAGPTVHTSFLSIAGNGSWTGGPRHKLEEGRNYGSAVMYDEGKILYAGGAFTTNTAEVLDLNLANPAWTYTGEMAFARRHHNLTVLPTGEVLATGGVGGTVMNDLTKAVLAAELWNPATGTWTILASNKIARGYHGTSLLLPDGRVLNAGSGEGAGAPSQKNFELFTPPYLLRGARPTISSAPTEARYGTTFQINTPQVATVTRVTLIRLGAVTHAFDENQRFQKLAFTKNATGVAVQTPASRNRTPPGHYMLFILTGSTNSSLVPSVAKIIRIW